MSGSARGLVLLKLADLIESHAAELAALEALDNGKPFTIASFLDIPVVCPAFRQFLMYQSCAPPRPSPPPSSPPPSARRKKA